MFIVKKYLEQKDISLGFIRNKKIILLLAIISFLSGCFFYHYRSITGTVMVASISSDGNYAVTTSNGRQAILWDIKHKSYKFLDRKANIYSAYFIKNTHYYMWQHDPDNEVYIKDTKGNLIEHFNPGFPTYGNIITSNLKHYIASDENWNLYSGYGSQQKQIEKGYLSFIGSGKLLNLNLSENEKLLVTSGFGGDEYEDIPLNKLNGLRNLNNVVVYNVSSGKPLQKFSANLAKTYATLSPDGKYVVAGDEGMRTYVWNVNGKLKFKLWDIWSGKFIKFTPNEKMIYYDKDLIKPPKDFGNDGYAVLSLKFIDINGYYLRFPTYKQYAILYNINDPKPIKYLPLGKHPFPSVDDYSRNASIDTAPAANILFMGKANSGGILVYKFDPLKQTLTKIWDGG
jgi:WD40 repeat protein